MAGDDDAVAAATAAAATASQAAADAATAQAALVAATTAAENARIAAAAAATAAAALAPPTTAKPFRPYGKAPEFDLETERDSFSTWLLRWDLFISLSTIDEVLAPAARDKYKTNQLLSCLSSSTLTAVSNAGLTPEVMGNHLLLIEHLRDRCNAGKNRHVFRQQFVSCIQRPSMTIDNWLCDLRDIARKCQFNICCNRCENNRLLGQLIHGVADNSARVKLLEQGEKLTLDQAINTLRTAELSKIQAEHLQASGTDPIHGIQRLSTYKSSKKPTDPKSSTVAHSSSPSTCGHCGYERREPHRCPAKGQVCRNCDMPNHFTKVCRQPRRKADPTGKIIAIHTDTVAVMLSDESARLSILPSGSDTPAVIDALPDTGSSLDAIPPSVYNHSFRHIKLGESSRRIETAIGSPISTLGSFQASIDWTANDGVSRPVSTTIHVLVDLKQPVISKDTQRKLGMIPKNYPHARVEQVVASPSDDQKCSDLRQIMEKYPTVFDGVCRAMDGPPAHFVLREGAIPQQTSGHRKIPEPLMGPYIEELQLQTEQGLLRKVPTGTSTPWIHGVVVVPKESASGGVRICVDFRKLNDWLVGTKFCNPTPFEAVRSIPTGMQFFTVLDGFKGYHMVPLDEESMMLTTFSTPSGLHQYTRLPMGIRHAGDEFGSRFHAIFGDIPNITRCMEDILAYTTSYEEMVTLTETITRRAAEHNIAFNTKKIVFAANSCDFAGYRLDGNGYRPSPELTRAILDFPRPANVTDLRSFYGLCQQVGNFSSEIASVLAPLSPLLKKDTAWVWLPVHESAFCTARQQLSIVDELAFYSPSRPTALYTDASRLHGLGFILKQQQSDGTWRVVQAGSRFLSPAETRYSMIEAELVGAAWGMKKCSTFLIGLPSPFDLFIDHRPLIPILNDYSLDQLDNPRILRLRLQMTRFNFTARWIPGKQNIEADALSRAPIDLPAPNDLLGEGPQSFITRTATVNLIAGSSTHTVDTMLERVKTAALADPILQQLREMIIAGFPNDKANMPASLRPYWDVRSRLAIDETDDMIVMGARIVVPRSMVPEMLDILLRMHQGASKMRQRARLSLYWPLMDSDITNTARKCESCVSRLPSLPKEPLKPHERATRPFEHVHADLGEDDGRHFLLLLDAYSGWPDITFFPDKNTTSARIIPTVRNLFTTFGTPVCFWSDNGTIFESDLFQTFLRSFNVMWRSSSPHYPQSNGRIEVDMKPALSLISGSKTGGRLDLEKMAHSLLLFRNAPRSGIASPAQLVFGRPIRDDLPSHHRSFEFKWQKDQSEIEEKSIISQEKITSYYNTTAHPLPQLSLNDHVLIQDQRTKSWNNPGIIIEVGDNRDYIVRTSTGSELRRNRRHLRLRVPVFASSPTDSPSPAPPITQTHPVSHAVAVRPNPNEPAAVIAPEQRRSTRPRLPGRYNTSDPGSEWTV